MCDTEEVEEIVKKRFDQYEQNQTITNVKNQTLNLKVRAQPNQRVYESQQNNEEQSQLLQEFRQMREDFSKVNKSNTECIEELKLINRQLVQSVLFGK